MAPLFRSYQKTEVVHNVERNHIEGFEKDPHPRTLSESSYIWRVDEVRLSVYVELAKAGCKLNSPSPIPDYGYDYHLSYSINSFRAVI